MSAVLERSVQGYGASGACSFVTMRVNRQMVGIPVIVVQDVLKRMTVARVPLAPREVAGVINLRGRIVTVLDMRRRLALPPAAEGAECMHCVVEHQDELFSLMVDSIGDVLNLPASRIDRSPPNLEEHWRSVAAGVCRLDGELLVVLDVQALLTI
jgi:purine-binding chemotaxis protein CheW